jgi:hypothetical protein
MKQIRTGLDRTDRRIRECNARIALYRQRVAARAKNPLAAQQAEQLLVLTREHLKQLRLHRRRLAHTLEMEMHLSSHEYQIPYAPPRLPRHMR